MERLGYGSLKRQCKSLNSLYYDKYNTSIYTCVCVEEFRSGNARFSTDQPFRTRKIYWFYKTKQERVENISDILPATSKSGIYNLLFSNSERPFLRSNSVIISFFARKLLKTLSMTYTHRVHADNFFFFSAREYHADPSRNLSELYRRDVIFGSFPGTSPCFVLANGGAGEEECARTGTASDVVWNFLTNELRPTAIYKIACTANTTITCAWRLSTAADILVRVCEETIVH